MSKQIKKGFFGVYVLTKNKKPVYVGCTANLSMRLNYHKRFKDFDNYIVLKQYQDKKQALTAEQSIILFLSVFGDKDVLNGRYKNLTASALFLK